MFLFTFAPGRNKKAVLAYTISTKDKRGKRRKGFILPIKIKSKTSTQKGIKQKKNEKNKQQKGV